MSEVPLGSALRPAGLLVWLALGVGAAAGEVPPAGDDPITGALGLRGHRREVLPPGGEFIRPLGDGRSGG